MFASVVRPDVASTFIVTVCPFVGTRYTVRCPGCAIVSMCPFDDGDKLRQCPMWKTCWLGHKFLVSLDDTPSFGRVACVEDSDCPHPMESTKKKPRVGPSRTEVMWDVQKVRERMGLVAPIDTRKPRPAPIQVPFAMVVNAAPPLHLSLTRLVAAGEVHEKKSALAGYDSDDEEVDIDRALLTMDAIAAETEMLEPDSP